MGKVAHDMMLSTGFMTYFTIGDIANITKSTIDVVGTGVAGAYNKDEGYGREMGEAFGSLIGSTAMAGVNLDFMVHNANIYGARKTWWQNEYMGPHVTEAKMSKGGNVYSSLEAGGFQKVGKVTKGMYNPIEGSAIIKEESRLGKALASKGIGGYIRTEAGASKWVKGFSTARGLAPMFGALAVGFLARGVLGFAGGLLDEAQKDYHRERSVHYDNRFFNTQREEQSNMQTLGMAMNNYENRFQSTARIYHSR